MNLLDPYEVVHFSRDHSCPDRWLVSVYRSRDRIPILLVESFTVEAASSFFADQLWCTTEPGQDFLWNDYPKIFRRVLESYAIPKL